MKRTFYKCSALVLALIMMVTMLCACGNQKDAEEVNALVDAAVQAALDSAAAHTSVTIEADGMTITVEEAEGKSIQQLLDEANITLNDGDVLSLSPYYVTAGNITISVLRKCSVLVVVADEDPLADMCYTAVLQGGTVADALKAVGVELAEDQETNFALDSALEDGMEIIISVKEEIPETEAAEETEATEATKPKETTSSSSSKPNSSSSASTTKPATKPTTKPTAAPTTAPTTAATVAPTTAPTTAPTAPPATERYVVSVDIYEDCDGSGHGVKVITYSDGTQEEVAF